MKYLFHLLSVFFKSFRSIQLRVYEVYVIMLCDGFKHTGVELIGNVMQLEKVREVNIDILIVRIIFQDLKGPVHFGESLRSLKWFAGRFLIDSMSSSAFS